MNWAAKQVSSARDLAGPDYREDDEAAKIDLTYSTQSDINGAHPTSGMLAVPN